MIERTKTEMEIFSKAAKYLPGSSTGNLDVDKDHLIILKEGKGSHVWDIAGREYIDYMLGSGPMILGHAHPAVVDAVKETVEKGSTFFATHEKAVLLAEEIVDAIPSAEKVRFMTSGTDADFMALRIARAYRGRDKILKFEGGYHGTSDYAAMSVVPSINQLVDYPTPVANSGGIPKAVQETVLIAPYNDLEKTTSIIEQYHDELGAVIVEPMQRLVTPNPGFLEGLRDLTSHYDIPLIFDEVVTGFRLAYGGAQEYYGVTPDLTSLGKIVGGGFALAAVAGKEELMSVFDRFQAESDTYVRQVGTLNGNPLACAAGLATLKEMRKPGTYERLWEVGNKLRSEIERLFQEAEIPIQSIGLAPLFGFYFSDEPINSYRGTLKADANLLNRFNGLLMENGVLKSWPDKFYPGVCHTDEDIEQTVEAFKKSIDQLNR